MQSHQSPQAGRWRFGGWLRGEQLTGNVELLVQFQSGRRVEPIQHDLPNQGRFNWTPVEVEFEIPENVRSVEVGFILKAGGTVWIDSAYLVPIAP